MEYTVLFVFVAFTTAKGLLPSHQTWESGVSNQYKTENKGASYAFGYNEDHSSGGSFRREISDPHGNRIGTYGLRDSDGRLRMVNYIADFAGYRADIRTNEPGMTSDSPASATVTKMNIGQVLVPGFVYSGGPDGVSFERMETNARKNRNEEFDSFEENEESRDDLQL